MKDEWELIRKRVEGLVFLVKGVIFVGVGERESVEVVEIESEVSVRGVERVMRVWWEISEGLC